MYIGYSEGGHLHVTSRRTATFHDVHHVAEHSGHFVLAVFGHFPHRVLVSIELGKIGELTLFVLPKIKLFHVFPECILLCQP